MANNLVSVIMPVYNAESHVAEAISSVPQKIQKHEE